MNRWVAGASASIAVFMNACATPEDPQVTPPSQDLRLNQIQVLGTHNSYALPLDPALAKFLDRIIAPGMRDMLARMDEESRESFLEYHPNFDELSFSEGLNYGYPEGLAAQLGAGLRSLEIDVFFDPEGGKFLRPAGYELLKQQGVPAEALAKHDTEYLEKPGFKVLHVADVDFRSTCNLLTACLSQLRDWSDANPKHAPVFILLETKDAGFPGFPGGAEVLPFGGDAFDALDAEIVSVLGRDRIITPDDVRGNHATLESAVLNQNWPALEDCRGKFVFLMLTASDVGGLSAYYEGRPNLEGRVAFLRSEPGQAHAAFLLLDNAFVRAAEIKELVRKGYLVRTRSDIETYEAKINDLSRAEAAFASGSQIVSTDFYKPGNVYGTDYVVELPGGGDWRCNPVNARCD